MPDFTKQYNTAIPPEKYGEWQKWLEQESLSKGRDIRQDLYAYDLGGYFLNKDKFPQDERGHLTDTFKKPNHITFSDESIYSGKEGFKGGKWKEKGGKWIFTPGETNYQFYSPQQLFEYFREREPDSEVILPE